MHSTFKFKIKGNKFECVLGAIHVSLHRFTRTFYATLKPKLFIFLKTVEELIPTTSRASLYVSTASVVYKEHIILSSNKSMFYAILSSLTYRCW
jgi:hypothetical protein